MKVFQKQFGLRGKTADGADISPEMLARINAYALKDLSADGIYVRRCLLAHNAIDRDNERFPETLLDNFAATLPGKSLLFGHDRRSYFPLGLFFDASTEEITADQFKALTGETPRLPDGVSSVKVLWGWFYIVKTPSSADMIANLEAGVYRHVSIGFNAADLVGVKKEINGPTLYLEYVPPGEALEGSLVWLGAQPGATAQKALKDQETHTSEVPTMKTLITLLAGMGLKTLTDTATEDQIAAGIKALIAEKDARIADLEAEASLGKAYREKTVADYVALKHKLGEVGDEAEKHASLKQVAAGLPFAFLETEVKALQTRVEKQFPADGQLTGTDGNAQRTKGDDDNPLIPKAEK